MPEVTAALLEMRLNSILYEQLTHLKRCAFCCDLSELGQKHRVARLG